MTKSAREVIAKLLTPAGDPSWSFGGGPMKKASEHIADAVINRLAEAGYVILPKEPSEEMIEAGLKATMAVIFDHPKESDTLSVIRNLATAASYRAMISTVGEEK